ncbi:hypothetical protein VCHA53O466_140066 [Vibrio chagasii]|nr:hypothetical protein VCHA53O466_140066 [Vibrio chagasii]
MEQSTIDSTLGLLLEIARTEAFAFGMICFILGVVVGNRLCLYNITKYRKSLK